MILLHGVTQRFPAHGCYRIYINTIKETVKGKILLATVTGNRNHKHTTQNSTGLFCGKTCLSKIPKIDSIGWSPG